MEIDELAGDAGVLLVVPPPVAAALAAAPRTADLGSLRLVVCGGAPLAPELQSRLADRLPGTVVVSITPYGLEGPYADRPATEFTVQAECGSIATRGLASQPPIMAGGRTTEWVGGTFAAVAALAAVQRARAHGLGEYVDFSLLEVMNIAGTMYTDLLNSMLGRPNVAGTAAELPLGGGRRDRDRLGRGRGAGPTGVAARSADPGHRGEPARALERRARWLSGFAAPPGRRSWS